MRPQVGLGVLGQVWLRKNMAIIHALPLYTPPMPVHNVQARRLMQSRPAMFQTAPPVKCQRAPEHLHDYAGPMSIFAPIMTAVMYRAYRKDK